MPDTDAQTAFHRVVTTFMAWEGTSVSATSDRERAESEFQDAMRAFLTTEVRMRALRTRISPPLVTSTQPGLADGVQLQGRLFDFPVDLAALMAEGWTSIHSLQGAQSALPCVVLESRSPMSAEEAAARAQLAALKLRFEGR